MIYNSESKVTTPGSNAELIDIDVSEYRFVRLQVSDNGSNGQDHSVWADIKLVKDDYEPYVVPTVEEMDAAIKNTANLDVLDNADHEIAILRRNLVKNAGQYTLTAFINSSEENRETMNWLYNNVDVLRMYTTGGKPTGTYAQSLEVLSQLYHAYRDDLSNNDRLKTVGLNGTQGEMYLKMMISISLTHSKQIRFWIRDQGAMAGNADSPNLSRPLDRYMVYKRMYNAGKLQTNVFESLEVEEMRYVMMTELGDDELEWLRDWLPTIGKGLYAWPPVPYISIGNHYWYDQNYPTDPAEQQVLIDKYKLKGANYDGSGDKSISGNYLIGFEAKAPHLWMINKYGGVCWQISNFGQNMTAAYGVPSTTFGQPGHVAYANYELGSNNIPAWALTNNVSGWQASNFTGYTNINTYHPVRQLNDWGVRDGSYLNVSGNQGTYTVLSQAALNDFENYENAEILVKLAEVYENGSAERESIYRQALAKQVINLDVWTGLIRNYLADSSKTAEEYYELAVELSEAMKRFPLPYYDMMKSFLSKVSVAENPGVNSALQILLTKTLKEASAMTDAHGNDQYFRQTSVTRLMGNYLLGTLKNEVAVFSFDGFGGENDYNTLKLGAMYEGGGAAWEYSLDGGNTWYGANNQSNQDVAVNNNWVTDNSIKLTDEQVNSISVENGILVHIQGVPRREENFYKINITKAVVPSNLYANDLENRVMGVNLTMEWREKQDDEIYGEWVSYRNSSPVRIGDVTIQVRVGATGTQLASDPSQDFHFTQDAAADNRRKYIPVSHLSVASVSSQATGGGQYGNAIYAIDGNPNTRWHSAWNGSDRVKEFVVKFDHTVKLSAFEYMPAGGGNGRILETELYGSEDGENFTLIGKVASSCEGSEVPCMTTWPNTDNGQLRKFELARTNEDGELVYEPVELNYLKIKGTNTTSASSSNSFIAARMFNFYEDRTDNPNPTAGIAYSTIEPTQGEVIARVVNHDMEIEFDDGSDGTHVFTENGSYTFEFHEAGNPENKGQAIAKVDWIIAEEDLNQIRVEYTCKREDLNGDVVAEDIDCSGTRKVNQSVSARVIFPEGMNVKILNNGYYDPDEDEGGYDSQPDDNGSQEQVGLFGKLNTEVTENGDSMSGDKDSLDPFTYLFMDNGEFTFQYRDEFGNEGEVTAKVDWIDKALPKVAVVYSTTEETEGPVTATIVKVPRETNGDGGGNDLDADGAGRIYAQDDNLGDLYDENGLQYDEEFIVKNNGGSREYQFADNGEFSFEYCDEANNCGVAVAKVDWIKKTEQPDVPEVPDNPNPDNPGGTPGEPDKPSTPDQPSVPDQPTPNDPPEGTTGGPNISENPNAPTGGQDGNQAQGGGAGAQQPSVNRPVGGGIGNGDQIAEVTDGTVNDQEIDENTGDGANGSTNGGGSSVGKPTVTGKEDDDVDGEFSQGEWYENPVIWWIAGGVVVVIIAGVAIGAISNRRR